MRHSFTSKITETLTKYFGEKSEYVFSNSELLQYINQKTVSANRGSKARGSFANLYAIYVLVEDYLNKGFDRRGDYSKYEGAQFSALLKRQRELPFGAKLQNHALNQRMNQEFRKYFPTCDYTPIMREVETKRYWINTNLIEIKLEKSSVNIAKAIIEIIDAYAASKQSAFESFIKTCQALQQAEIQKTNEVKNFILGLLAPNIDARVFEIVSYAILKADYDNQTIYFGLTKESIHPESLKLYKTGRTNANDGGIDFVMKPIGRFFQVTETTDVKKYFLDIDKLEKFPVTFVIKSCESIASLMKRIKEGAQKQYSIEAVVNKYINCIEEIITIDRLKECLESIEQKGNIASVLAEIIKQSKVEFNYDEA